MVDLVTLVEDIADHIRRCPQVLSELDGNGESVAEYIDQATVTNSLARAVYTMPNGSVLVAWINSTISATEQNSAWEHLTEIYVRAVRMKSPLQLLNAVIDGIPDGSDLPWRYLCVNEHMLPMHVNEIARIIDEEGIDYYVIRASFLEKGDYFNGVSGK